MNPFCIFLYFMTEMNCDNQQDDNDEKLTTRGCINIEMQIFGKKASAALNQLESNNTTKKYSNDPSFYFENLWLTTLLTLPLMHKPARDFSFHFFFLYFSPCSLVNFRKSFFKCHESRILRYYC